MEIKVKLLSSNDLPLARHPRSHNAYNYGKLPNRLQSLIAMEWYDKAHSYADFLKFIRKIGNYGCWCQIGKTEGVWSRTPKGCLFGV